MKRVLSFIIIFLIFIFVYQYIVVFFSNSHEVNYKIESDNKEFNIKEIYEKNKEEDGYYLEIENYKNKKYAYYIENNYNKQKRIVKEIKTYQKDNYLCIYPITDIEKEDFEILCSNDEETYSYDYVNKEINISEFIKKLKIDKKYKQDIDTNIEENNIYFYTKNFYKNEYLGIYRYKYLTVYNNGVTNTHTFSDKDIYINELGVYIKNYFLVPIIKSNDEGFNYLVVDIEKNKSKTIIFDTKLSNNLYNIGIIDDKLYIFDLTNKIEYEINPKEKKYQVIGTVEDGFKMYENGKWIYKIITEFTKDKITYDKSIIVPDLEYKYDYIYETNQAYYLVENNKVYRVYKKNKKLKILLLELNDYNNLKIDRDRIYYISNNYLYRFDQYGVKILVNNNEFKYNNHNIYNIYNSWKRQKSFFLLMHIIRWEENMDIYEVKKNETIEDIAKKFNLTVFDLQSVNDIDLYQIKEGDKINIPFILTNDFTYFKVQEGNTLKKIADQRKIGVKTLAYLNGLDIDDYIYPNQILIVPRENVSVYVTSPGDTIRDLERNFGFSISKILEDNLDIYLAENQLLIQREIN